MIRISHTHPLIFIRLSKIFGNGNLYRKENLVRKNNFEDEVNVPSSCPHKAKKTGIEIKNTITVAL
jgi:hypothetical protein